jgi:signal transduction histidine kinase
MSALATHMICNQREKEKKKLLKEKLQQVIESQRKEKSKIT